MSKPRVLVACEESQAITIRLRAMGIEAYSCDILPPSGGHPDWHIKGDVAELLKQKWDAIIGFPPCTYLTVTGNRWLSHPDDAHMLFDDRRPHPMHPHRRQYRQEAIQFFMSIANADCDLIAIENPVGAMSTHWRKPDQIVQPFHFGDEARKSTCLWLKNLPKLEHTNVVGEGKVKVFKSGKRMAAWYSEAKNKSPEECARIRSKTFPGIADAMADKWGNAIKEKFNDA